MIPVSLPSGKEVMLLSSVAGLEPSDSEDVSSYHDVAFHIPFQELVDVAVEIGDLLHKGIQKITPSKATVELSVGIDAASGKITAFFVEGGINGSIRLVLEWAKVGQGES